MAIATILVLAVGCIKAPDIDVNASGWGRERPNTAYVPETRTHEEAKQELRKAHAEIEHLRRDNAKLEQKIRELEAKLNKR